MALLAPTAILVVPLTLPLGIVFVRQPHKISLLQCRILQIDKMDWAGFESTI